MEQDFKSQCQHKTNHITQNIHDFNIHNDKHKISSSKSKVFSYDKS